MVMSVIITRVCVAGLL